MKKQASASGCAIKQSASSRSTPPGKKRAITLALMLLAGGVGGAGTAYAADADKLEDAKKAEEAKKTQKLDTVVVKGKVEDRLGIMPTEPVKSVFGFDMSVKETPRSVTSISSEVMNNFNITDINDLVALSPGAFTQSFFGVAGSLDLRGTPGEVYFRGVRRIENPGNYPTPIGASDRIDIVRGPASPIYGPSRIGGYLNFIPKSARAETGQYLTSNKGQISVTRGSWDKNILTAEVGGPGKIFDNKFGYYLYAQDENSGSYYQNTSTKQSLYQGSVNMDLTSSTRIEFGGMYQNYNGNQVAGWNRLTQSLIDNGTYITGSPASVDSNGDGLMSATEIQAVPGGLSTFIFNPKGQTAASVNANLAAHPAMKLLNPGTAHLDGSQVLVQEQDVLKDEVTTLYFDFIHDFSDKLNVTNKLFYENLDNLNENAYGFSQYAKTYAFEDDVIFGYNTTHGDHVKAAYQFSPSIRYQNFDHGDNYAYEFFDRRDLTKPGSPIDTRTLATRGQEPYSNRDQGRYIDTGVALLGKYDVYKDVHLLLGGRYDWLDMESTCVPGALSCGAIAGIKQTGNTGAKSWSASLSYDIPKTGFTPYVTIASQTTMITGQGGQIAASQLASGNAVAGSRLKEYGVKANVLDNRLYLSLAHFVQERTDYNAQDTVTNNTTQAKGIEFEFRGVLTNNLVMTGAWTNLKVYNLSALQNGNQFSFAGAGDLPAGVNPADMYGGTVAAIIPAGDGRKAGIPENMYSLNLLYNIDKGMFSGVSGMIGVIHADSVYSGFSKAVKLPAYTLLNAGISYETKDWKVALYGKNLTNERYFRSNFPDLFGSSVVLPELPRNYQATVTYKF
jgi:iron complex outermembrane receptor protein